MTAKIQSKVYRFAVYAGAFFSMAVLVLIVGYILIKGIPHLSPELFAWDYNSNNVSMMPSIINTLLMTMISLMIALTAKTSSKGLEKQKGSAINVRNKE